MISGAGLSQRILVIEDDALLRDAVDLILDQGGYLVATTGTGQGAADIVARFAPDLILLDIQLPDTTGLHVLSRLRALGHRMPIVMMTANNRPETVRDVMTMGGTGYLLKPFNPQDLVARVRLALKADPGSSEFTDI